MIYFGHPLAIVIDGLDGVDACWHFAGIIGIRPERLTLRRLWQMVEGRARQQRAEMVELASLVWGAGDIDLELYILRGQWSETGRGGPPILDPELQAKVDARIEEMRAADPSLPKP